MPRLSIAIVALLASATACGPQGATIGANPSAIVIASPTPGGSTPVPTATPAVASSSPSPMASAMPTASASAVALATGTPSPTPLPTTAPTTAPTTTAATPGPLVIAPNPTNFGLTSVLGSSQTANISQLNYSGPFTIPAGGIVCTNGTVTSVPITGTISGSTLEMVLGALGVTGACTITVDGAPGTSGTEVVNLSVPLGTPGSTGSLTFSPNPVDFDVVNGVTGTTATSVVTETGYAGSFSLPANPVSCPFNLVPLSMLKATLVGNTVTLTTGLLNASVLGSCSVTVDDANGNSGALTVNFQLL